MKWALRTIAAIIGLLAVFRGLGFIREDKTASEAAPRAGHFVQAGDTQVFVQESGPPGRGARSGGITPLAGGGFHTVAIDLPPLGYSAKPEGAAAYSPENQARRILGVLDALGIEHAIFVGHSVGARPTIEAAVEAPALGFQANAGDAPHFQQNDASFVVRTIFGTPAVRNAMLATYGASPLSTRPLFRSFVSKKEAVTDARVKGTINGYGDWMEYLLVAHDASLASDFQNFRKLAMPVFILWGDLDTVTPLWQGEQLKKLIPNAELAVISNTGHIPFVEDAGQFNGVLLKGLGK